MKKGLLCFVAIIIFVALGQAAYAQPAFIWEKNFDLQTCNFYAVCFGNNTFVAVGGDGAIKVSRDGDNWSRIGSDLYSDLFDVIYADGKFVAVGGAGTIITSQDGVNWTKVKTEVKNGILRIHWNGKQYLAATRSNLIISSDLKTWEELPLDSSEIASIAYGNNKYVIVKRDGKILTSTDGYEWKEKYTLQWCSFSDVIYNGNMFVAVGTNMITLSFGVQTEGQSVIMTSPDGENWHIQDVECEAGLDGITWNGEKFVIAGSDIILSSEDGNKWDAVDVNAYLEDVAFGNGVFAAVGYNGVIISSNDGDYWETKVEAESYDINDVIWHDNRFIAAGEGNASSILVSEDGEKWTATGPKEDTFFSDAIAWDGEKYVVLGIGSKILTSPDGVSWQMHNMDKNLYNEHPHYNSMVWDGEKFVVVGHEGLISISSDGLHWTEINSGFTDDFNSIAWKGNLFVAVGGSGINKKVIITSPDGVNWETRFSEVSDGSEFNSVIWAGGQFVTVGGGGLVLTSPDGINWTKRQTGTTNCINDITWIGNMYVAVADFGLILTSPDGINWSTGLAPTGVTPLCVTWNGEKLVAAGYDSTILTTIPTNVVKVKVNDKPIIFDVAPVISEGRTLVPLRYIFEALGAEVKWDAATRTVTGIKGSDEIVLKIDSKDAVVNGETRKLDVPATILNGRTLVPARFISESLGAEVLWDGDSKTVIIKTES